MSAPARSPNSMAEARASGARKASAPSCRFIPRSPGQAVRTSRWRIWWRSEFLDDVAAARKRRRAYRRRHHLRARCCQGRLPDDPHPNRRRAGRRPEDNQAAIEDISGPQIGNDNGNIINLDGGAGPGGKRSPVFIRDGRGVVRAAHQRIATFRWRVTSVISSPMAPPRNGCDQT